MLDTPAQLVQESEQVAKAPMLNIDDLSTKQLKELIVRAEARIKEVQKDEMQATRAKLNELIASSGFDVSDLFPGTRGRGRPKGSGSSKSSSGAKYRSPRDPNLTWTGKGRQPNWIKDELKAGKSLDAFLI